MEMDAERALLLADYRAKQTETLRISEGKAMPNFHATHKEYLALLRLDRFDKAHERKEITC